MPYRCYIEYNHAHQTKDVYVYEDTPSGSYLLVPDVVGYERVPIEPGVDNSLQGPTIQMNEEWADTVLRAFLESEHGHTGSESLLSDRLDIETQRFDKLLDKMMEQL